MKSRLRTVCALAFVFMLPGALTVAPASAQGRQRVDRDRRDVRRDVRDIRADERRLRELESLRDRLARRHDWRAVREIDRKIERLLCDIAQRRRDIRRDSDRFHRYRDRDEGRSRGWRDDG